jgi:hypothetical protein
MWNDCPEPDLDPPDEVEENEDLDLYNEPDDFDDEPIDDYQEWQSRNYMLNDVRFIEK